MPEIWNREWIFFICAPVSRERQFFTILLPQTITKAGQDFITDCKIFQYKNIVDGWYNTTIKSF